MYIAGNVKFLARHTQCHIRHPEYVIGKRLMIVGRYAKAIIIGWHSF